MITNRWPIQKVLIAEGYRLVDDAWDMLGRRTYLHDEDATREFILGLAGILGPGDWQKERNKLRSFHNVSADEIIEIETGGAETSGHFLHHMKASLEHSALR